MPAADAQSGAPPAVDALALEGERGATGYPPPFRARVAGRSKVKLGDRFGLTNFGVNLTRLEPGAESALRHWHTAQDEFIYVLDGTLVLVSDGGEQELRAGMCAGFPAGRADGHHLVNRGTVTATYLEVGDRSAGDEAHYPDDDLHHRDGGYVHRDGSPW